MSQVYVGKHVVVREFNIFFSHVRECILHHYDTEEFAGTVFVLGDYIWQKVDYFRRLHPGKRIVAYQLEQLCGGPNWHSVQATIENLRTLDEVWEYDALNATYLGWHAVSPSRIAPMRHVPSLRRIRAAKPDYDVLFYGFVNERRQRILDKIQRNFYGRLRYLHAYGLFGPELDELIGRSKVVLNLHAFEPYHRQEQVRIFYPLINGRCVLSERSQVNYFGDGILEFDEGNLRAKVEEALDRWVEIGQAGASAFEQATSSPEAYARHVAGYVSETTRSVSEMTDT